MPQTYPAQVGDHIENIDTPALIVDLNAYERNLNLMSQILKKSEMHLRPHGKTHKSPLIALDQIKRGAVGVCCQKISEAEVMVNGGVNDILVSNQVVGRKKIQRLANLAKRAKISVCADNENNIIELSTIAIKTKVNLDVLVEIDVGGTRCGVSPGKPALKLAKSICGLPNLTFCGLQAYHGGAQHIRNHAHRRAAITQAAKLTSKTAKLLEQSGITCNTLTGGGTGSMDIDLTLKTLNELQAGSYVFMDADYGRNSDRDGMPFSTFENSLYVRSTIMSIPRPDFAIIDAGLKALAFDSGNPMILGREDLSYTDPSDEHGTIIISGTASLQLGATITLIPGHCDPTVNLYDWYVGIRGSRVEKIWPVAARGAIS